MKIVSLLTFVTLAFGSQNIVLAQTPKAYLDLCTQNQVNAHKKLKEISANDFRAFCDCTYQQLSSTLNSAQLDELQKSSKRPSWLKPAEEAAGKACLKPESKLQA